MPNQALFPLLWWLSEAPVEAAAQAIFAALGLDDVARWQSAADAWLDALEEFLEAWGRSQGVEGE